MCSLDALTMTTLLPADDAHLHTQGLAFCVCQIRTLGILVDPTGLVDVQPL